MTEIHKKGWGYENWLVNTELYCGKILHFNHGKQCSLHYHKIKDETFYWDMWYDDDIIFRAKDIGFNKPTKKQVQEIFHTMKENFDACYGINWDTIDNAIIDVMEK